jgi:hypothetical protein
MSGLLGPKGEPIEQYKQAQAFVNKKGAPPKLGEAFGAWAGRDMEFFQLPGGGIVQFDLSKLEVQDFRNMRDHYQVNSSLAVLSFMQHQSEYHVECKDKRIATAMEEQLNENWTSLNRGLSQANWAGYSPLVLDYENNTETRLVDLDKIKDLVPDECTVNWKEVEGWAPPGKIGPKFKVYDGIKQLGQPYPVPVENSLWYPLLMENGDYYGRKLLRPAFTSWFFSILVHLFANRYYERFGEPVPVGRAPYDEEVDVNGANIRGNEFMLTMLQQLRSRSVVVLPNDKDYDSNGRPMFDYDIEYLESQMRGADFERYMTRLDEEISIGLFTPILLLRTADVGSYNLGVGHMQMYLWMLNAMNDDRAQYINKYLLRKMVDFNFSPKAPSAKIKFRKLGNTNAEMIKDVLTALISNGSVKPDIEELGILAGLTLKEVKETVDPAPDSNADPSADPSADDPKTNRIEIIPRASLAVQPLTNDIKNRVRPQVEGAFRGNSFNADFQINMGYKRKMEQCLKESGFSYPTSACNSFYGKMDNWINDVVALGQESFGGPEEFMNMFSRVLDNEIEKLFDAS